MAGDHVLLSQLLMDGAIMQTAAPLEAAVRNGHTEATSVLLRHCRTARLKRPLDAANVVANVLNWAASGYCSLRGPAIVTMLVRDKHIELLRKGPLDSWQRLSLLLGKPGTSTEDNDDSFTESGRAAIAKCGGPSGAPLYLGLCQGTAAGCRQACRAGARCRASRADRTRFGPEGLGS